MAIWTRASARRGRLTAGDTTNAEAEAITQKRSAARSIDEIASVGIGVVTNGVDHLLEETYSVGVPWRRFIKESGAQV